MHNVELMEEALRIARQLNYGVRHEWLGGVCGGACEVSGRKWIFVDLSLNTMEQLEQVIESLRAEPVIHTVECSEQLRNALGIRQAA